MGVRPHRQSHEIAATQQKNHGLRRLRASGYSPLFDHERQASANKTPKGISELPRGLRGRRKTRGRAQRPPSRGLPGWDLARLRRGISRPALCMARSLSSRACAYPCRGGSAAGRGRAVRVRAVCLCEFLGGNLGAGSRTDTGRAAAVRMQDNVSCLAFACSLALRSNRR
jgi:hypothetical protein